MKQSSGKGFRRLKDLSHRDYPADVRVRPVVVHESPNIDVEIDGSDKTTGETRCSDGHSEIGSTSSGGTVQYKIHPFG
jgi:hypothetical protein